MFLISKIVRGRRLMHQLEQEEAAAAAGSNTLALPGQSGGLSAGRGTTSGGEQQSMSVQLPRRRKQSASKSGDKSKRGLSMGQVPTYGISTTVQPRKITKGRSNDKQQKVPLLNVDAASISSGSGRDEEGMRRSSSLPSITTRQINSYDARLTKFQKRSLRFTWHRLLTRNGGKRVESVFEEIYERLLRNYAAARDMFRVKTLLSVMSRNNTATVRDHSRATAKMIDMIIRSLDRDISQVDWDDQFDPRQIGKCHGRMRSYGFRPDFWEKFGEIAVDVILSQEAVRDLPGAAQAWVILTACVIDQLRMGFDDNKGPTTKKTSVGSALSSAKTGKYLSPRPPPPCPIVIEPPPACAPPTAPPPPSETAASSESVPVDPEIESQKLSTTTEVSLPQSQATTLSPTMEFQMTTKSDNLMSICESPYDNGYFDFHGNSQMVDFYPGDSYQESYNSPSTSNAQNMAHQQKGHSVAHDSFFYSPTPPETPDLNGVVMVGKHSTATGYGVQNNYGDYHQQMMHRHYQSPTVSVQQQGDFSMFGQRNQSGAQVIMHPGSDTLSNQSGRIRQGPESPGGGSNQRKIGLGHLQRWNTQPGWQPAPILLNNSARPSQAFHNHEFDSFRSEN